MYAQNNIDVVTYIGMGRYSLLYAGLYVTIFMGMIPCTHG